MALSVTAAPELLDFVATGDNDEQEVAIGLLAELASTAGSRFLFVSTDMVFDGNRGNYCERDAVRPLSIYGKSKASAESEVLKHGEHAVVRVTLLFGPTLIERPAFFDEMVVRLRQQRKIQLLLKKLRLKNLKKQLISSLLCKF